MNDTELAIHLSSFLDPAVMMESVRRYDEERPKAVAPAALLIGSGYLTHGEEGNYLELAKQFLRGFQPPNSLMSFLKEMNGTDGFSRSSWRWLEELSLTCDVQACGRGNVPEGCPSNTILIVKERDAVIDLIRDPLYALSDMVGRAAVYWRKVAELGARIYFEANSPNSFYTYVEHRAASYFVNFVAPSDLAGETNIKNRYRAVTIAGPVAQDDSIWRVARDRARAAAASTLEPIKEKY